MKEMIPLLGNNNTTNTNSNNTFNVQMFLDNQCKDAMSIQDFVNSIELNMSHMLAISKDGYVDSISNVLIHALNKLELTDRPLHCTDLKRETIYIKDQEAWNKSTADAPLMNRVITNIENKHYALVGQYVKTHPQTKDVESPECELYTRACMNSLGNGEDHSKLNKKICKQLLPSVKLEKEMI
jgi:sulfur relay (sulfurtransferase) DsrC/TusE family protein